MSLVEAGTIVDGSCRPPYDAERDPVLASDKNTGLWILRVTS